MMRLCPAPLDFKRLGLFLPLWGILLLPGCGASRNPAGEAETAGQPQAGETPAEAAQAAGASSARPAALMKFEEANGFEIYQRYCLVCHGELGHGDGFNAFNLDPKPRSLVDEFMSTRVSDRKLAEAIRLGGRKLGKSPQMPAWGRTLGDRRIRYVVSYIRLLQRRARESAAESAGGAE